MTRQVRVTEGFWAALDLALPAGGEPSWHAFAAQDLPEVLDEVAGSWDELSPSTWSGCHRRPTD